MHLGIIGRVPRGAVLRGLDMAARAGCSLDQRRIDDCRLSLFQLQPVILDLTAGLDQQIIVNPAFERRIAEPATGGLIRDRRVQIKPAEKHEIQPDPERTLQLRIRQPVPLPDQQAVERNQRIIPLRPDPRPPQTTRHDRRKRPQIQERVDLRQNILIPNPIRRLAKKNP